jgi:glycosyltransferase involved in cell wall biosynthesis
MRVLYLNHVSQVSGAEISLLSMVEGARSAGVDPRVVLPGPGPLAQRLSALGVPVDWAPLYRVHRTKNPLRLARLGINLERVAHRLETVSSRDRIDLVHSNSTTAHLFAAYARRRIGRPLLWHARDLVPLGRWAPWLSRQARCLIAISQVVADKLVEGGAEREKIAVIHPGVAAPETHGRRDEIRAEWGCTDEQVIFGMVGQVVPWKGHRDFLDAALILTEQDDRGRFVVVGDDLFGDHPVLRAEVRARAATPPLRGRTLVTGQRQDIGDVLDALDCLVLPSHGEPFGRVLVEAMLLGKPVIATDAGGPREIVQRGITGLLVPQKDPSALAAAMLQVARNRTDSTQMGEAGRRRAQLLFSVERNVEKTVEVYRSLLG